MDLKLFLALAVVAVMAASRPSGCSEDDDPALAALRHYRHVLQPMTSLVGKPVVLDCLLRGLSTSKSKLIWTKNHRLIRPDGRHYRVFSNGTLVIARPAVVDSGSYRCLLVRLPSATTTISRSRHAVPHLRRPLPTGRYLNGTKLKILADELNLNGLEFNRKPPETLSTHIGNNVEMFCEARLRQAGDSSIDILETWSRFNRPMQNSSRVHLAAGGRSLRISNLRPEDAGDYVCVAASTSGHVIAATTTVLIVPRPPEAVVLPAGEASAFDCTHTPTSGDRNEEGVSSIEWAKDGHVISNLPHGWQMSHDFGVLSIHAVAPSDAGVYECSIRNRLNEVIGEYRWRLSVSSGSKPQLVLVPRETLHVEEGGRLEAQCTATGSPTPVINWFRHVDAGGVSGGSTLVADSGNLLVEGVTAQDAGVYTCTAFNDMGEASTSTVVHVQGTAEYLESRPQELSPPLLSRPSSGANIQESDLIDIVDKVREEVSIARQNTLDYFAEINHGGHARSPQDIQDILRQPDEMSASLSQAAEIYDRSLAVIEEQLDAGALSYQKNLDISSDSSTDQDSIGTHFLSNAHLELIANLSGCRAHRQNTLVKCSGKSACFNTKYRTVDGTCNNMRNPTWGASHSPFTRLLPAIYENGLNEPVGWNADKLYHGYPMPSARLVSTRLLSTRQAQRHATYTHMLMQWGQFIDHDLTFTPQTLSHEAFASNRLCNDSCRNESPCFPIVIPEGDARINRHACIGVTRSAATCGTGKTSLLVNYVHPREQFNQLTAYLDASAVYGSTAETMEALRDRENTGYLLRVGPKSRHGDKYLLPFAPRDEMDCQMDQSRASVPCFYAGDHRANEQLGLLSLHTLWMREHNRIAHALRQLNPEWSVEVVFQETRKMLGAQMQHITYSHWLPKIVGPIGMAQLGPYRGYNASMQPDITNEFATAAFRFGHTIVMPTIFRFDEKLQPLPSGHLPLHEAFFAPYRIIDDDGGIDAIVRGLFAQAAKHFEPGSVINVELTERLFTLAHDLALDLASLNVQRGRDHALAGYAAYRRWCGFGQVRHWDDLRGDIGKSSVFSALQQLYGHPHNIDLFAGLVSEDPVEGAIVGPTLMCLLVDQFRKIRDGDRFWYEKPGVFSEFQLSEVRQSSLARIICDNSDNISRVQPDVFTLAPSHFDYADCDSVAGPDLAFWRDCCYAEGKCVSKPEMELLESILDNQRRLVASNSRLPAEVVASRVLYTHHRHQHAIPRPRNIYLDPNLVDFYEKNSTSTDKDGGEIEETASDTKEMDELAGELSKIKEQVAELRREVGELKVRIRYRNRLAVARFRKNIRRSGGLGALFGGYPHHHHLRHRHNGKQ